MGKVCAGQPGFTVGIRGEVSSAGWSNQCVKEQPDTEPAASTAAQWQATPPAAVQMFCPGFQVLIYPFCSLCVSEEGGSPFHIAFCTLALSSLITTLVQGIILDMDFWTFSLEPRILEVQEQDLGGHLNKLHTPMVFQRGKTQIPQDHPIFCLLNLIKAKTVHTHVTKATWNSQCCYWNPFIFIEIWYVNTMHEKYVLELDTLVLNDRQI